MKIKTAVERKIVIEATLIVQTNLSKYTKLSSSKISKQFKLELQYKNGIVSVDKLLACIQQIGFKRFLAHFFPFVLITDFVHTAMSCYVMFAGKNNIIQAY